MREAGTHRGGHAAVWPGSAPGAGHPLEGLGLACQPHSWPGHACRHAAGSAPRCPPHAGRAADAPSGGLRGGLAAPLDRPGGRGVAWAASSRSGGQQAALSSWQRRQALPFRQACMVSQATLAPAHALVPSFRTQVGTRWAYEGAIYLSFLPMAHIYGRWALRHSLSESLLAPPPLTATLAPWVHSVGARDGSASHQCRSLTRGCTPPRAHTPCTHPHPRAGAWRRCSCPTAAPSPTGAGRPRWAGPAGGRD